MLRLEERTHRARSNAVRIEADEHNGQKRRKKGKTPLESTSLLHCSNMESRCRIFVSPCHSDPLLYHTLGFCVSPFVPRSNTGHWMQSRNFCIIEVKTENNHECTSLCFVHRSRVPQHCCCRGRHLRNSRITGLRYRRQRQPPMLCRKMLLHL